MIDGVRCSGQSVWNWSELSVGFRLASLRLLYWACMSMCSIRLSTEVSHTTETTLGLAVLLAPTLTEVVLMGWRTDPRHHSLWFSLVALALSLFLFILFLRFVVYCGILLVSRLFSMASRP